MHTEMWEHAATQANVATLTARGAHLVPPGSGRLTGADTGPGRLPEPEEIFAVCRRLLEASAKAAARFPLGGGAGPLAGRRVVITAGGTREPIDPVRFLGNRSSGKQGYALASVAAARGAFVTLISANPTLPAPPGVEVVVVSTALELQDAVTTAAKDSDVVVMAAAVADFRPRAASSHKIKKTYAATASGMPDESAPVIELVRNPDILAGLVEERGSADRPILVGFAAETGDETGSVLELAQAKLARKGCDVLVANEVGGGLGFGTDGNTVHVLYRPGLLGDKQGAGQAGSPPDFSAGPAPKAEIAAAVWNGIQAILEPR
jgi:phosphopantothenoylcysteine decarboxylase/phosphopantothenate--cysteine ligase